MFDDWYLPRMFYRVVAILLCVCHSLTREVLLWCVPGIFFKCRFWFSMSGVVKLHLSNRIPTGADAAGSGTTRRKVRPLSALNLFLLLSPALSLCLSHTDTILSSYYIYIYMKSENDSYSVLSNSLRPHGLYSPWTSPRQNTGVSSLSLLQGIFPTQGSNPGLPHCRWVFTSWATGKPKNIRVGSLSLLQQIFPTQESNWCLLHCRRILYQLSYQGSPCIWKRAYQMPGTVISILICDFT